MSFRILLKGLNIDNKAFSHYYIVVSLVKYFCPINNSFSLESGGLHHHNSSLILLTNI